MLDFFWQSPLFRNVTDEEFRRGVCLWIIIWYSVCYGIQCPSYSTGTCIATAEAITIVRQGNTQQAAQRDSSFFQLDWRSNFHDDTNLAILPSKSKGEN